MSSCCGGNCGCGASCKCANGCGGCKMYPDMSHRENITTETQVLGVATDKIRSEGGAEQSHASQNEGCKCDPCECDPCKC